jgi:hypothetical protein
MLLVTKINYPHFLERNNARQEQTYLMADVKIVMAYKCYKMNPHKLEQLVHGFFGRSCLNIYVFDI